ncbi:hypothetical protein EZV62_018768 [Acer yangbiense]|uniref:ACT domain-containing protein n=1 Tax=Acer yangbiense TaxID=1000413 RepID=A0A5C7HL09_9ROSI|nr:hypothetical protein EZV62_018768 [Acer yangbiense]
MHVLEGEMETEIEIMRLRLVFENHHILSKSQRKEGLAKSWFLFKPKLHKTISDLSAYLLHIFGLHHSCPHGLLSMDGFALLPFESTCVLKDKDVVCVRKKAGVSAEIDNLDDGPEIVKLLANEEFDKETGGYESEFEEDEHEESLHALDLEDTPVVDKISKKKKALNSKKLQGSKRKKSKLASAKESLVLEDVENDVRVVKSGNSHRFHKKNHVKKDKSFNVQGEPEKSSSPEIDEQIIALCAKQRVSLIFSLLLAWIFVHSVKGQLGGENVSLNYLECVFVSVLNLLGIYSTSAPETMICRSSASENGDGQKEDSPVKGTGMAGVPGTSYAIFGAVKDVGANVIMISQASSQHSVCFAVPEKEVKAVAEALQSRFRKALNTSRWSLVQIIPNCIILATVGQKMAITPGVSATLFNALAKANINVRAIAQGYSEYNITVVIKCEDCIRALRAVHSRFYLSRTTKAMGIIGLGLIGATLLDQLRGQTAILKEEFNIDLRVMGITGSETMLLSDIYLFNNFVGTQTFSEVVSEAKAAGYTEPDPRDNLSGTDVARKVIILARESGLKLEYADLPVQSLVPEPFKSKKQYFSFLDSIEACASAGEFIEKLPQFDHDLAKERQQAEDAGEVLRYVREVDALNKKGIVELRRYKKDHPFALLLGSDNIISFTTTRYKEQPLIVRGPGAGAQVTAGGEKQLKCTVLLWKCPPDNIMEYEEHEKRALSVDFSCSEPSMLVSGSDDCKFLQSTVLLFSLVTCKAFIDLSLSACVTVIQVSVMEYEEHEKRALSVDFSCSEPSMLVSGSDASNEHLVIEEVISYLLCHLNLPKSSCFIGGRISNQNVEDHTHAVFMPFQRKEDLAKFYENPFYLRVLKENVTPYCHGLMNVDYESEVEDDILLIFRKGEEFNFGVEFVLIAFVESAVNEPIEDALASLRKLTAEFPSLIVQSTQEIDRVQLRLVFENHHILSKSQRKEVLAKSWFLFKPKLHKTISDLSAYLLHFFGLHHSCPQGLLLSVIFLVIIFSVRMDGFALPPFELTCVLKDKDVVCVRKKVGVSTEIDNLSSAANASPPTDTSINSVDIGKTLENALLDERSLLTCIVCTIPAGGRILISSTLPNRLGKMLAPLHWHDYKKQYGKLEDFVASHPELFVIEGDYIQLREGAQEMIAATAAYVKVAAAAATSSPYSSALPSVAHLNGGSFGMAGGLSNVKILSKSRDPFQLNGANFERSSVTYTQSKGPTQGKPNTNLVGKQQGCSVNMKKMQKMFRNAAEENVLEMEANEAAGYNLEDDEIAIEPEEPQVSWHITFREQRQQIIELWDVLEMEANEAAGYNLEDDEIAIEPEEPQNSEATRTLAILEEVLENELGEIQNVLLAMQEQQHKQLDLNLAIRKTGKLLESRREPSQESPASWLGLAAKLSETGERWVQKRLMKLYIDCCNELCEPPNMKLLKRLYVSKVEDEVIVSDCELQDISITPLLNALHANKTVAMLDLSHNLLGNGTMEKLQQFFKTSSQKHGDLTLDLHCNRYGPTALFQVYPVNALCYSPDWKTGIAAVPGTTYAIFGAVRDVGANVIMISQASSEHSVCFAVPEKEVKAVAELRKHYSGKLSWNMRSMKKELRVLIFLAPNLQCLYPAVTTASDKAFIDLSLSVCVIAIQVNSGNQLDVNGGGAMNTNYGVLPNGNGDNAASFVSSGNASTQTDRVPGVPMGPSSLLGLPTYLPPGQAASEVSHMSAPNQHAPSQTDQNLMRSDAKYEYDLSVNGQALHSSYVDVHISRGTEPDSVISSSAGEAQVIESVNRSYLVAPQPEQNLQQISAQFYEALRLGTLEQNREAKERNDLNLTDHGLQGEVAKAEKPSSAANASPPTDTSINSVNIGETTINNGTGSALPEALISTGQMNTRIAGKT